MVLAKKLQQVETLVAGAEAAAVNLTRAEDQLTAALTGREHDLDAIADYCRQLINRDALAAYELGEAFWNAKAQCRRQKISFDKWKFKHGFSKSMVSRYMRMYDEGDPEKLKGKTVTDAYKMLGLYSAAEERKREDRGASAKSAREIQKQKNEQADKQRKQHEQIYPTEKWELLYFLRDDLGSKNTLVVQQLRNADNLPDRDWKDKPETARHWMRQILSGIVGLREAFADKSRRTLNVDKLSDDDFWQPVPASEAAADPTSETIRGVDWETEPLSATEKATAERESESLATARAVATPDVEAEKPQEPKKPPRRTRKPK